MIHKQLKQLRLNSGYKQQWVADQLGISQTNLSEIESVHLNVSISTLDKFCKFYNKPLISEAIKTILT